MLMTHKKLKILTTIKTYLVFLLGKLN